MAFCWRPDLLSQWRQIHEGSPGLFFLPAPALLQTRSLTSLRRSTTASRLACIPQVPVPQRGPAHAPCRIRWNVTKGGRNTQWWAVFISPCPGSLWALTAAHGTYTGGCVGSESRRMWKTGLQQGGREREMVFWSFPLIFWEDYSTLLNVHKSSYRRIFTTSWSDFALPPIYRWSLLLPTSTLGQPPGLLGPREFSPGDGMLKLKPHDSLQLRPLLYWEAACSKTLSGTQPVRNPSENERGSGIQCPVQSIPNQLVS